MKKLTKQQRHEAYKYAHKKESIKGNCYHLIEFYDINFNEIIGFRVIRELFPELYIFEPRNNTGWAENWFDNEREYGRYLEENQSHRKTILEFCIEMTK